MENSTNLPADFDEMESVEIVGSLVGSLRGASFVGLDHFGFVFTLASHLVKRINFVSVVHQFFVLANDVDRSHARRRPLLQF